MRALISTAPLLLAMYLSTLPAHAADELQARKLINAQGCKACHTLEGVGGNIATSLEEAGRRLTAQQLRQALVNPKQVHGDSRIPDFRHLHPDEIDALVNFLKQLAAP